MNRARVGVVIATRDRAPSLAHTLRRLHDLPERPPVVVDNAADLAAGRWLTYADHLTVHHHPSVARDATLRRGHGIRNALWFT
jgi:hypothetical protein